ncbi:hypothetical protein [Streptomyces sp. CoT10]|uniref:hypothetical protein n=1 Tax=Streptomyces sp. CoT10 TaxID=2875762 RepID=UPI001CD81800|nr:hypothetical protein [Streptomyces sp. CoT10]
MFTAAVAGGRSLALAGGRLSGEDARVLRAFTGRLCIDRATRQLERIAGNHEDQHEHSWDGEAAP